MRSNEHGFVAMADAMLFIVVIMVATVVVVAEEEPIRTDDRDASAFLEALISSEVRMSDLDEGGDDSLVRLSDMMALHIHAGSEGTADYIRELLDAYCRGRGYLLTLTFGNGEDAEEVSFGEEGGIPSSSAERTVPVTSGGELRAVLSLYRRGAGPDPLPSEGMEKGRSRADVRRYGQQTVFRESGSLRFPTIPSVSFFYLKRIDR